MNELDEIIAAFSKEFQIGRTELVRQSSHRSAFVRSLVAYFIKNGFAHLMKAWADLIGQVLSSVYHASIVGEDRAYRDCSVCGRINFIARNFRIPELRPVCRIPGKTPYISTAKRMFGFDWSEDEEKSFAAAYRQATEYMQRNDKDKAH